MVAEVDDSKYAWDVLVKNVGDPVEGRRPGSKVKTENFEDLFAVLRFARDILEGKAQGISIQKIREFGKEDLFRRFSLDVFSAIHLLYDKSSRGRNSFVRKFYRNCLDDDVISKSELEERISEVRSGKFEPDFAFKI